MQQNTYNVLGVMSGTSLDGVDLARVEFFIKDEKWEFKIFESQTIPYATAWLDKLKKAVDFSKTELEILDQQYTQLLAEIIAKFIQDNKIENLDAVCSHGHTILHEPQNNYTLQIGNLPQIATLIKQKVVCDFRVQDVELGGQGAPLVPIGDQILFSQFDSCLNLGGFSNISYQDENRRLAFDISPVNTVLNFYANKLGLPYDDKGKIAQTGKINANLLNALNQLDFYQKKHPKSLGFEFVKNTILPIIEDYEILIPDKLNAFIEHIATQTSKAMPQKIKTLLITGGGTYNDFLIHRIQFHLPKVKIQIPDPKTIEFKEALIFALLGVLKLRNEINVLKSVTGASRDHSSGKIYIF
jgi:anhydro-N-acetylmuramic acid kinase